MDSSWRSSVPGRIVLSEMAQRREMRTPDEDWTGTTSSARRRRLQNRLNQRACERRKASSRRLRAVTARDNNKSTAQDPVVPPIADAPEAPRELRNCTTATPTPAVCTRGSGCLLLRPGAQGVLRQFAKKAYEDYILGNPQPGYLSTLIQINVFNALTQNGFAVGFSNTWQAERILSPFTSHGPDRSTAAPSYPQSLQPTALQRQVPHHPWIDLFPLPEMRDNILRVLDHLDLDELCGDLLDVTPGVEGKPNLMIWGDSWDPRGWEASPAFLRKWGWMLRGCVEIQEATNYWRERRGEKKISF